MYCSNCGVKMGNSVDVCKECGQVVEHVEESGNIGGEIVAPSMDEDVMEKTKETSLTYMRTFFSQLKSPFFHARKNEDEKMANGIISMGIFALAISLTIYMILKDIMGFFIEVPFFSVVSSVFLGIGSIFLIVSFVIFVTLKLMNIKSSYAVLINRLGSLLALPVVFAVLAFAATLFEKISWVYFLISVSIGGAILTFFLTMFSYERVNGKGIDPYYGSIFAGIGLFFVIISIITIVLTSLGNTLQTDFLS